ncbi:YoaK family protein [Streptomyces sp. NPDC052077]|uniref:YoaK family protein n=1 Tax=Streptomyces sp. NPDC052077 TaxID=3154757 RepID=UPI003423495C
MRALLTDAYRTLVPPRGERHGPLPPLLLVLTLVTGLTDAVSFLALGRVFVANMTGNVVFMGFSLVGAPGLSALASGAAVAAFLLGALTGGRLSVRLAAHRGRLLSRASAAQAVLFAVAAVVAAAAGDRMTTGVQYALIVLLSLGMGLQNAVARRLGVPDLTTTVLTLTLTGLAADSTAAGGAAPRPGRRVLAVLVMFLGALGGARLVLDGRLALALALTLPLLGCVAVLAHRFSAGGPAWTRP